MEEERSNLIKAITTPLGFFALSLLIVEGFLGIVLGLTSVGDASFYFIGMIIGALLFLLVVTGVWLLVWYRPEHIVKAGRDYVEIEKAQLDYQKTALDAFDENTTEPIIKTEKYE